MRGWLFAVVSPLACGGRADGFPDAAVDAGPPDVAPQSGAAGKFVVRFFPDSGEIDVPRDLSKATIDARAGDTPYPGSGHADGTFSIPNVPVGPFMLHVLLDRWDSTPSEQLQEEMFIAGAMDGIVLTQTLAGRPDADRTPSPFNVALNVSNVAPITLSKTAMDMFVIASNNAGCVLFGYDWQLSPKPSVGDTALSNASMAGTIDYGCHIDPSKGDHATLYQVRPPASSDPLPHVYAMRSLDVPNFSSTGKAPTKSIDGAMIDVATTNVKLDFRPSTFVSAMPGASAGLAVGAAASEHSFAFSLARVPEDGQSATDGIVDIAYPNPFPNGVTMASVYANRTFPVTPIDPMKPVNGGVGYAASSHWDTLERAQKGPLGLVLAPPGDPQIENAAPFAPAKGVGLTPTIHWARPNPAPPGPIVYAVQLTAMQTQNGLRFTTIYTTATSVTIPAGVLASGKTYTAFVRASWSANQPEFGLHPFDGDARDSSSTSTGELSP